MREDVLQAHQPHQDFLVGLLGKRVSNNVELDDAPPLLQPGGLITGSVWCQQISLEILKQPGSDAAVAKRDVGHFPELT